MCAGTLRALSVLSAQERGDEVQPAEVRLVGRSIQAASLPLVRPPLSPSRSPAILVPENFLPQFCGNTGIVTHSPPQTILILGSPLSPPLPPTSSSTAASEFALSSGSGKAPGWRPPQLALLQRFGAATQESWWLGTTAQHCLPAASLSLWGSGSFSPQSIPRRGWLVK